MDNKPKSDAERVADILLLIADALTTQNALVEEMVQLQREYLDVLRKTIHKPSIE